jgi:hypothetical protein
MGWQFWIAKPVVLRFGALAIKCGVEQLQLERD